MVQKMRLPNGPLVKHNWYSNFWPMYSDLLPIKLTYPLKNAGWKTIFLWNGPFSDDMKILDFNQFLSSWVTPRAGNEFDEPQNAGRRKMMTVWVCCFLLAGAWGYDDYWWVMIHEWWMTDDDDMMIMIMIMIMIIDDVDHAHFLLSFFNAVTNEYTYCWSSHFRNIWSHELNWYLGTHDFCTLQALAACDET